MGMRAKVRADKEILSKALLILNETPIKGTVIKTYEGILNTPYFRQLTKKFYE